MPDGATTPPPTSTIVERTADVLRRRARALAAPARTLGDAEHGRLLVFRRGAERFGVALERVAATFVASGVTPLPGAEPPVRGVVAWRSRPLAVYDLASGVAPLTEAIPLVVVGDWARAVALVADELEDVVVHDDAAGSVGELRAGASMVRALTADAVAVVDVDAVLTRFAETP